MFDQSGCSYFLVRWKSAAAPAIYPSTDAIDQSFAINGRSKDWAAFQKSIRRIATPEWENMFAILMAKVKKDPSKMT
ncbi:MAG: hypothetical protein P8N67_12280, partial [Pseudomonadales bacterium]|nr:hypothetical protein [Pseudomonadales bacterium]